MNEREKNHRELERGMREELERDITFILCRPALPSLVLLIGLGGIGLPAIMGGERRDICGFWGEERGERDPFLRF